MSALSYECKNNILASYTPYFHGYIPLSEIFKLIEFKSLKLYFFFINGINKGISVFLEETLITSFEHVS